MSPILRVLRPAILWLSAGVFAATAAKSAPLRVGYDAVLQPVAYVDAAGQPKGFAADYVRAVAKEAGLELTLVTGRKEQLQADFKEGRLDAVAVLVFTEERAKAMDFTLSYLTLKGAAFVRKGSPALRSTADFAGRRVAISRGNFTHDYMLAHPEWGATLVPVDSTEAALLAVNSGDCDAAINVDLIGQKIIRDRGLSQLVRAEVALPGLAYKYHMAVHRGDSALVRQLDEAQLAVRENGEYARLYEKWIGPLDPRPLEWRDVRPFAVPAGLLVVVIAFAFAWQRRNLTLLSRHADALRQSEARLNLVLESGRHCLWDWNVRENRIVRGPMLARLLGYEPGEIEPTPEGLTRLIHPEDHTSVERVRAAIRRPGEDGFFGEARLRTKDGGWRWISSVGQVLERGPDGRAWRAVGTHTDITARKAAEQSLRESEARFRRLSENAPDVIFRFRFEPTPAYDYISPALERISGYKPEEFYADPLLASKLAHPDDRARVQLILASRSVPVGTHEIKWLTRDGRTIVTEQRFVPVCNEHDQLIAIEGIARDITEMKKELERRRSLELQLNQAQKMESIGALAGGIAHDFNNILTGVLGFTEIAQISADDRNTVGECLTEIRKAGLRARDLVAQILTFSRQRDSEQVPVDFSRLAAEALKFLRASTPATVRIERYLAPGTVRADPTQLHQVILNLATNAIHAMRERGGLLTLRVEPVEVDAALAATMPKVSPGSFLRLIVRDTGHGMDPATLHSIFEPFFTTKPTGEGTGLGLAVVQGIVRAHHGGITVESTVGVGTTFQVFLPVCVADFNETIVRPPVPAGNGEHVLVVDDEVSIGEFAGVRLEHQHYRVAVFNDPQQALAAVRAAPEMFDAVVSNFAMPGLNGLDLVRELRRSRADLPAVIITGNREAVPLGQTPTLPHLVLVDKPFTGDDLVRALQSVLPPAPEREEVAVMSTSNHAG